MFKNAVKPMPPPPPPELAQIEADAFPAPPPSWHSQTPDNNCTIRI